MIMLNKQIMESKNQIPLMSQTHDKSRDDQSTCYMYIFVTVSFS